MSDTTTPTISKTPAELFKEGTRLMKEENYTREQVFEKFVSEGVDRNTALNVCNGIMKAPSTGEHIGTPGEEHSGSKDMIVGALWCVGGILVTAYSYSAASGGGSYVVAWGAIIFGGIQFFRGAMRN